MPTVHVSEGPGGTLVLTPSPVRHGAASCTLLVLSQEDLPVLTWCFVCCVCILYMLATILIQGLIISTQAEKSLLQTWVRVHEYT